MYKRRITKWGFLKNLTKHRANTALNHAYRQQVMGKGTELYMHNRPKNLLRYLARKKTNAAEFMELDLQCPLPTGMRCHPRTLALPDLLRDQEAFLKHLRNLIWSAGLLSGGPSFVHARTRDILHLYRAAVAYRDDSGAHVTQYIDLLYQWIRWAISRNSVLDILVVILTSLGWTVPSLTGHLWRYTALSYSHQRERSRLALGPLFDFLTGALITRGPACVATMLRESRYAMSDVASVEIATCRDEMAHFLQDLADMDRACEPFSSDVPAPSREDSASIPVGSPPQLIRTSLGDRPETTDAFSHLESEDRLSESQTSRIARLAKLDRARMMHSCEVQLARIEKRVKRRVANEEGPGMPDADCLSHLVRQLNVRKASLAMAECKAAWTHQQGLTFVRAVHG
jgi:hypothetical protein